MKHVVEDMKKNHENFKVGRIMEKMKMSANSDLIRYALENHLV